MSKIGDQTIWANDGQLLAYALRNNRLAATWARPTTTQLAMDALLVSSEEIKAHTPMMDFTDAIEVTLQPKEPRHDRRYRRGR